MGEVSLSKWACLPLLTSCLEGRDMVVKAEGGVEEAALPRPGVVGPLASLELLLTCVGVAGLRQRAGFSPKMRIGDELASLLR